MSRPPSRKPANLLNRTGRMKLWVGVAVVALAAAFTAAASGDSGARAIATVSGKDGAAVSVRPDLQTFAAPPRVGIAAASVISAAPDAIYGESDGVVDLTVSLSAVAANTVTVNYIGVSCSTGRMSWPSPSDSSARTAGACRSCSRIPRRP